MSEDPSTARTRNYVHQIKGAVVYKAMALLVSFMYVPLMIHYLGQEQFGVWATLLTVMSWLVFFDLGVGNGLRNKVAESLARNLKDEARLYVASGYTLVGMMAVALYVTVSLLAYFVPWQTVFNTLAVPEETLRQTVQISAFFILLNFWLGLVGALLNAVQQTSTVALGQLISNVSAWLLVFALSKSGTASLTDMAIVYGVSIVASNILLSAWFYLKNRNLRPHWNFNTSHMRPLLAVGMQFLAIQLAVLVIFTTDKILITQLFGPQFVTPYEVVFKLFSIITFAHALISAPLWSAYTDAYHRGDVRWIRGMLFAQMKIYAGVVLAVLVLVSGTEPIIELWVGPDLEVPLSLVAAMALFVLISTWNNIYAMFINGTGKIKMQLYTSVIAMFFNIPLALLFTRYFGMDVSGVVLATCVSLSLAAIVLPIQTRYLVRNSMGIA